MTGVQRLGLVAWWLGAVLGGLCVLGALVAGFSIERHDGVLVICLWLVFAAILALPAWALCFILAGTFWRPPQQE